MLPRILPPKMLCVLDFPTLRKLLEPFGVPLNDRQEQQLLAYLELLLKWNAKINLTAIESPEECVTRHFGESLYLTKGLDVSGRLLDIGSGAGFPGLVLKLANPLLSITLLEPVAKKRAFLKEAARVCEFGPVVVRGERLEDFGQTLHSPRFDLATARAVGGLEQLVPQAVRCLNPNGLACLWLGHAQAAELGHIQPRLDWRPPIPIPLSRGREIWVGSVPESWQHIEPQPP
ncbi:MAG: 16S rRNA (guanine(527)-N(7))-methyltransferase RsmG [Terriglobia bacterium]